MDLILLLVAVVVVGFVTWLLTTKIPMPPLWASTIQVVVLALVLLWIIVTFFTIPNFTR